MRRSFLISGRCCLVIARICSTLRHSFLSSSHLVSTGNCFSVRYSFLSCKRSRRFVMIATTGFIASIRTLTALRLGTIRATRRRARHRGLQASQSLLLRARHPSRWLIVVERAIGTLEPAPSGTCFASALALVRRVERQSCQPLARRVPSCHGRGRDRHGRTSAGGMGDRRRERGGRSCRADERSVSANGR